MGRSPIRSRERYEQVLAKQRVGDLVCARCGKGPADGVAVVIHHANYDKMDNDPHNLVPLCHSCHSWVHRWVILNFTHMVRVPKFMYTAVAYYMAKNLFLDLGLLDNPYAVQWLVHLFEKRLYNVWRPLNREERDMLELLLPRWKRALNEKQGTGVETSQ